MIFLFRKKRSVGANNRFVTVRLYACNEYKIITVVIKTGIDFAGAVTERTKSRKYSMVKTNGFERFMTSECTKTLILAFTSKTG